MTTLQERRLSKALKLANLFVGWPLETVVGSIQTLLQDGADDPWFDKCAEHARVSPGSVETWRLVCVILRERAERKAMAPSWGNDPFSVIERKS